MKAYLEIEMPKNCFDCPLFDDVYTDADGDDDYSCGLGVPLDYYQASGEARKDCPLVPAADVRPVVKAVWKHVKWVVDEEWQEGGYWISRCSNCSMPYNTETPFCPHCGADMREKN